MDEASPSRRPPGRRAKDRIAVASVALGLAAAGLIVWATSDSSATQSTVAATPAPKLDAPSQVPAAFTELWREPSAATPVPVAQGSTVVTGHDREVVGRDPITGAQRWRYARDLQLCTVGGQWSRAVAVYTKGSGCSEVTALDADRGHRVAQRNGDAEVGTQLLGDGTHLVTTGTRLINVWSKELLRTMEIGQLPAPVNPGKQPRAGCAFDSIAVADDVIATLGPCPGERSSRLITFKTTHHEKNESRSDEPKELYTALLPGGPAHVVAVTDPESKDKPATAAVVADLRMLLVYGPDGKREKAYRLDLPDQELTGRPDGGVALTSRTDRGIYWFTGSRTIALGNADLEPKWTLNGTTGTATGFAGELLVPIRGGLAVVDEETGKTLRTIAIDRGDYTGPVRLSSLGPVLLEQRGETLVALR